MMHTNPMRWGVLLVVGLVGAGCAAEPAGDPALSEPEVRSTEAALDEALTELAATHGIDLDPAEREEAVRSIGDVLAAARESDVGSTTEALESEDLDAVPAEDLGEATGTGPSTSGGFGVSGAGSGSFGTSGTSTSGSFGTGSSGGGSFDGPEGARSGGFGSFAIPCRNFGVVVALDLDDPEFANELLRGLDCVVAGSSPLLRWDTLEAAGPYTLFTLTFDLNTIESLASGSGTPSSFLLRSAWGPITTSGRSIAYGGPALTSGGGLGILVGVVAAGGLDAPNATGLLIAVIQ